jgi:hypothetical protein
MSAQPDAAPRRPSWYLSDPAYPGDRLVFAALNAYRVAIREGRYTRHHELGGFDHLERRMQERDIDLADVLRAVAVGRICTFAPRARHWIGGGYLLADVMVYVQAPAPGGQDFSDLVPSICSAWRVDNPIEHRPLAVPLLELARPNASIRRTSKGVAGPSSPSAPAGAQGTPRSFQLLRGAPNASM